MTSEIFIYGVAVLYASAMVVNGIATFCFLPGHSINYKSFRFVLRASWISLAFIVLEVLVFILGRLDCLF